MQLHKDWSLEGKKALITGGSKGIGKAIVSTFSKLGAEIIIVARNSELFHNIDTISDKITCIQCDVSVDRQRSDLYKRLSEKWGHLDFLINNVGMNIRKKLLNILLPIIKKLFLQILLHNMTFVTDFIQC